MQYKYEPEDDDDDDDDDDWDGSDAGFYDDMMESNPDWVTGDESD
jgi:hypothetical protein